MASKKVDSKNEVYKTRGMKTKKQPVGMHESHKLSDGYHDCADGSKSAPKPPANSHKLKKYS